MKTDLTLYELMGEDMSIFAEALDTMHVHVEVFDETDKQVYFEKTHIYAWESLVGFSKKVLCYDERVQEQMAQLEEMK
jgi:hypothetical protein